MKHNKIVLIQPPFYRLFDDNYSYAEYPLSLGYLANAIITNTEWDVVAYNTDFNKHKGIGNDSITFSYRSKEGYNNFINNLKDKDAMIWKEIQESLTEINPSVVSISTMSQNFKSACRIARIAKEMNSNTVVIVGGPHPSMVGTEVLDCPDIDIGVMGEGERTISELLNSLTKKQDLRSVNGIIFRENGEHIANKPRELNQNLDSFGFPHSSAKEVLKDYEFYPKSAFGSVLASRGCPYSCTFCGSRNIWGQKVRFRSPVNVLAELKYLRDMGINSIRFADDTFGLNKAWTKELCDYISNQCQGMNWRCEVNVNLITDEFLDLVKNAGCHMIELGVESGDNNILKQIKKNITIEQSLAACRMVNRHKIELQAYIIIGFPDETEESLQRTRDAVRMINGYIWLSIFSPFPGTELYKFCIEKGLIDKDYDIALHYYQNLDSFCMNISRQRFKYIASKIMAEVDRKNSINSIKRIFSINIFWKIRKFGVLVSLKKGLRIFSRMVCQSLRINEMT